MISLVEKNARSTAGMSASAAPPTAPASDHRRDREPSGVVAERDAGSGTEDRTDVELTLAADVEELHPEGDCGAEAGEERAASPRRTSRSAHRRRRTRCRTAAERVPAAGGASASRTTVMTTNANGDRADRDGDRQPPRLLEAPLDADHSRRASRHQQAELLDGGRSPRRVSPTIAPSYMTAIRSASARISSRSSEISSTPTPSAAACAQVAVHRLDRGDVEPARRRRDDEHARAAVELAREHDLLQVAAGQLPRRQLGAAAAHVVALDQRRGELADRAEPKQRASARPHGRDSDLSTTFDAIDSDGATPVCSRSSGTCATPARIAARGVAAAVRRPSTVTTGRRSRRACR